MGGCVIELENFDIYPRSGISYGGHAGQKKGILIDGERWIVKYPKTTVGMKAVEIPYTTSPISEYLGSKIYASIGIPTQNVKLGVSDGKLVVACKDFLRDNEKIFDFNMIRNEYDSTLAKKMEHLAFKERLHFNSHLEEIMLIMQMNSYFKVLPDLQQRFWDMFIVDAFIHNNDRNEENWGVVHSPNENRVSLVFDNGSAFCNKMSNKKFESLLSDETKFKQLVYENARSVYRLEDKPINPLKYIESMQNINVIEALIRIVPKIDFSKIQEIFDEIPKEWKGITVLSNPQREMYLKMLKFIYRRIFIPTYQNVLEEKRTKNSRQK